MLQSQPPTPPIAAISGRNGLYSCFRHSHTWVQISCFDSPVEVTPVNAGFIKHIPELMGGYLIQTRPSFVIINLIFYQVMTATLCKGSIRFATGILSGPARILDPAGSELSCHCR